MLVFSMAQLIMALNSITGGSTALTVVFGWNVVIKYVPLFVCYSS